MVMILICGYIGMMNWTRYVFNSKYSEITKQTFIKEIKHENGFPISPTVFENKLSVMYFWTTSCGVCYKKFPDLQELYIDYSDNKDIAISAVNVLYPKESPSDIYHSIRERGWSFPLFFLAKDDLNKYDDVDLNFYPYVLVLDYDNTVLYSGGFNYHPLVFVDNVRTIIEKYHNRTNKQSKNHL